MKTFRYIIFSVLLFAGCHAYASGITDRLKQIPGLQITPRTHPGYREFFEILVDQPIDHFGKSDSFQQKIYFGFNDTAGITVMQLEGYDIPTPAPGEMAGILKGNVIIIEHRYCGTSAMQNPDWRFLNMKQSAEDNHYIRSLFSSILKGKWLTTGTSKGGQAALAYKMYYPAEADATVVFSTPVKMGKYDNRINDFLNDLSETDCGKQVREFQRYLLTNRKKLVPLLKSYTAEKGLKYTSINIETVFEYMVLEYEFSFWQGENSCADIPQAGASMTNVMSHLYTVISPRFYADSNEKRRHPAFYMAYHELGYYEYEIAAFEGLLSTQSHANIRFAPVPLIVFNDEYLSELRAFLESKEAGNIVFVYGENDPWGAAQPLPGRSNSSQIFIAPEKNHQSGLNDLLPQDKDKIMMLVYSWLE